MFMEEFLDMKYNRPEVLMRMDESEQEKRVREANKAMKDYAKEIEIREMINRKVQKLNTYLIYESNQGMIPQNAGYLI